MTFLSSFCTETDGLKVVWEDGERVFCRGWCLDANGNRGAVLAVLPAAMHPSPANLDRLTHEYGLKDELNAAWAARPQALGQEHGRPMLMLEDPGGRAARAIARRAPRDGTLP
jgi:hypothetical protein